MRQSSRGHGGGYIIVSTREREMEVQIAGLRMGSRGQSSHLIAKDWKSWA